MEHLLPRYPGIQALSWDVRVPDSDRAAYEGYNEHPDHVRFVQERWLAEVSDFLELEYEVREREQ